MKGKVTEKKKKDFSRVKRKVEKKLALSKDENDSRDVRNEKLIKKYKRRGRRIRKKKERLT